MIYEQTKPLLCFWQKDQIEDLRAIQVINGNLTTNNFGYSFASISPASVKEVSLDGRVLQLNTGNELYCITYVPGVNMERVKKAVIDRLS